MNQKSTILTVRESRILMLMLQSYSQKMIADQLQISIETVRTHIKHIKAKLGLHTITELINWAHENGMRNMPEQDE